MTEVTIGPCRLINGDCLEALRQMPDDSVDCTVTSPPYNTLGGRIPEKPTGRKGRASLGGWAERVKRLGYDDDMPEPEYQAWLRDVIGECLRVSRGLVWVNHKIRYRDGEAIHPLRFLPFPLYSEVIWDRPGAIAFNCRRFAPSHEGLWGFGRPHFWDDKLNKKLTVWQVNSTREAGADFHSCPFPRRLVSPLIRASCPEGGTVLDPFSGAATTGVVCVSTCRSYVGIEKRADYFEGSCNRIREAWEADQSSLFSAFAKDEEAIAC